MPGAYFGILATATALVCLASLQAASAAQPQLIGVGSGFCIAVTGGSNAPGTQLVTWECDGEPRNQWEWLEPEANSKGGQIKGVGSGLCFAVTGGSTVRGANVVTWHCDNVARNQWVWLDKGSKGKMIQGVGSGLCLAVAGGSGAHGANIVTWDCDDEPRSQWNMLPAGGPQFIEYAPQIEGVASKFCIAVTGGSPSKGTQVVTWDCDHYPRNQWEFLAPEGNSEGGQIRGVGSNLCLAVTGGSTAPGANVVTWDCDNVARNQWRWLDKGGRGKMIQGIGSNLCLAVAGGSLVHGANIVTWHCDNEERSQWNPLYYKGGIGTGGGTAVAPVPAPTPTPAPVPNSGSGSGSGGTTTTHTTEQYEARQGADIPSGTTLASLPGPLVLETCGRSCAFKAGCDGFVFNDSDGSCVLKDSSDIVPVVDEHLWAGYFVSSSSE